MNSLLLYIRLHHFSVDVMYYAICETVIIVFAETVVISSGREVLCMYTESACNHIC